MIKLKILKEMKKTVLLLLAMLSSMGLYAQKNNMAVGIDLGVAPCVEKGASLTNIGIGGKFQYGLTESIRLEGDIEYWFKDKATGLFDISVNAQYLFNVAEKIKVYPILGIGYGKIQIGDFISDIDFYYSRSEFYYDDDESVEFSGGGTNKFLVNAGLGAEYSLTDNISLFIEAKYQYIKDFCRIPIQLGLTYKF